MDQESEYLNSSGSLEQTDRARKMAKVVIAAAVLGVVAGLSASYTFFFIYKLLLTPLLAILSGKTWRIKSNAHAYLRMVPN